MPDLRLVPPGIDDAVSRAIDRLLDRYDALDVAAVLVTLVDRQSDMVLEYLAWEHHIDFWERATTREAKIAMIQACYDAHRYKGKPCARPMLGSFRRDTEFVVHAAKAPARPWTRQCFPGVYQYNVVPAQKVHLTSKPLPLLVDLLGVTPEGGTVLDPFVGGGTTPVACIETGRRFLGVELSQDYFDLAGERIGTAEKVRK